VLGPFQPFRIFGCHWPMTGRISPAHRFSRISARSRVSWRGLSGRSPGVRLESYSRAGRIVASTRSARLWRWSYPHGLRPRSISSGRSMRACPSTSVRPTLQFAPNRSILVSTQYGANIATGSHRRSAAHFSAAMPGSGERSSMRTRCELVPRSSWERMTLQHSLAGGKASRGRRGQQNRKAPRGQSFAAIVGRFSCASAQVATIRPRFLKFGWQPTDSCHTWCATSSEHYSTLVGRGELRNGSMSFWPSETAGSGRSWRRLKGSRLCESDSTATN
jgi:hypothetical protein